MGRNIECSPIKKKRHRDMAHDLPRIWGLNITKFVHVWYISPTFLIKVNQMWDLGRFREYTLPTPQTNTPKLYRSFRYALTIFREKKLNELSHFLTKKKVGSVSIDTIKDKQKKTPRKSQVTPISAGHLPPPPPRPLKPKALALQDRQGKT